MEKLPHYNFPWTVCLQKNMWYASSGDKLKIALFGELSLEEATDLSRDRQILEAERMHDGAPVHFSRAVRDVLNNVYHDPWTPIKIATHSLRNHWSNVASLAWSTRVAESGVRWLRLSQKADAVHLRLNLGNRYCLPNIDEAACEVHKAP
jgi:hypothetical protein